MKRILGIAMFSLLASTGRAEDATYRDPFVDNLRRIEVKKEQPLRLSVLLPYAPPNRVVASMDEIESGLHEEIVFDPVTRIRLQRSVTLTEGVWQVSFRSDPIAHPSDPRASAAWGYEHKQLKQCSAEEKSSGKNQSACREYRIFQTRKGACQGDAARPLEGRTANECLNDEQASIVLRVTQISGKQDEFVRGVLGSQDQSELTFRASRNRSIEETSTRVAEEAFKAIAEVVVEEAEAEAFRTIQLWAQRLACSPKVETPKLQKTCENLRALELRHLGSSYRQILVGLVDDAIQSIKSEAVEEGHIQLLSQLLEAVVREQHQTAEDLARESAIRVLGEWKGDTSRKLGAALLVAQCLDGGRCDKSFFSTALASPKQYFGLDTVDPTLAQDAADLGFILSDLKSERAFERAGRAARVLLRAQDGKKSSKALALVDAVADGDYQSLVTTALCALGLELGKKGSGALAAIAVYAGTYAGGTAQAEEANRLKAIRKEAIKSLVDVSRDATGWTLSLGASLGASVVGMRLMNEPKPSWHAAGSLLQLSLPVGLSLQDLKPEAFGFHLMLTLVDIGQYASFSLNGTNIRPEVRSSVSVGAQIGLVYNRSWVIAGGYRFVPALGVCIEDLEGNCSIRTVLAHEYGIVLSYSLRLFSWF